MKRILTFIFVLGLSSHLLAQVPHGNNDNKTGVKLLNISLGVSDWGVPLFVQGEYFLYNELTVGGGVGLFYKSEQYGSYKYHTSGISVGARCNYYFDKLINLPAFIDLYAGAFGGFLFVSHKATSTVAPVYSGSRDGGLDLGLHVGSRYYFSDKWAANIEASMGTTLGAFKIGATYRF